MSTIFVLALHHGSEGYSAPVQAYRAESEARAALALAQSSSSSMWHLFEVPIWPEPAPIYFDIKPVALTATERK
jgi:hypothetical protein